MTTSASGPTNGPTSGPSSGPNSRPGSQGRQRRARTPAGDNGLDAVGLRAGEAVRFRRRAGARWTPAVADRLERDGSVGLRDPKGAAVAIAVGRIEVRTEGPRGGSGWEPLADRLARTEQLRLL